MYRLCFFLGSLVLMFAGVVSGGVVMLPPGYVSTEGPGSLQLGGSQGGRLQTVFDASLFSSLGNITLTGISVRADSNDSVATGTTDLSVTLDPVSVSAGYLVSSFATNLNGNAVNVFNEHYTFNTVAAGAGPRDFDINVVFSTNFAYSPSSGLNLLLDFQTNSPVYPGTGTQVMSLDASLGSATPGVSSVINSNVSQNPGLGALRQGGLILQFSYIPTPTPEPGTWGLFAVGLLGVAAGSIRRRRALTKS
jgi:hypothetical protein